ncbi:hemerythrin domain-containing protein [Ideonella sp. A 288]|uniref:hemerythrin domain-containing protein n=1 Tax=Ideonella sp. A 288 TaxID=1962181 RepID=UPI000B4A7560|nr:hemerythrin domain-containing protein [Ideonella sp. A 288]
MNASASISLPGLHSPGVGFDQPFEMLDACHDRVRRSLALLQRLLDHLDAHGPDADARAAAGDVWRYFDMAAPHHHQDEERHVVPRLMASGDARLAAAAQQMLDDHRAFEALWSRLGPALAGLRDGSVPDPASLRSDAEAFVARHDSHLPLEDGLAFPAARAGLPPEVLAAMGAEMAARRRPGG